MGGSESREDTREKRTEYVRDTHVEEALKKRGDEIGAELESVKKTLRKCDVIHKYDTERWEAWRNEISRDHAMLTGGAQNMGAVLDELDREVDGEQRSRGESALPGGVRTATTHGDLILHRAYLKAERNLHRGSRMLVKQQLTIRTLKAGNATSTEQLVACRSQLSSAISATESIKDKTTDMRVERSLCSEKLYQCSAAAVNARQLDEWRAYSHQLEVAVAILSTVLVGCLFNRCKVRFDTGKMQLSYDGAVLIAIVVGISIALFSLCGALYLVLRSTNTA